MKLFNLTQGTVIGLIVLLASAASPADTKAPTETIVLVNATVVDINNGQSIPDAVVLIDGKRIKAVGPAASVKIPHEAQVISLSGRWLLPGLMNMHTHMGLNHGLLQRAKLADETPPEQVLRMAGNARLSLLSGVTTIREVGEPIGLDFALKKAIEKGEVIGPRIEATGSRITTTAGGGAHVTSVVWADGPYGLSQLVRKAVHSGASWIKIKISGGISDTHGDINAAPMTDEELATLIEVAHRNGAKVTAHNGSNVAAEQAMKFGIDGFEHGYHFNEKTLRNMKKKGVWLVPTIVVSQPGIEEYFAKIGSAATRIERMLSVREDHWKMLQTAIRLRVKIALGTDQLPYEPNSGTTATVREAEYYVEAGMTPLQALQSATIQAARLLDMQDRIGSIEAGKFADIIAVKSDPLKDISALRTISFVMKEGQVYRKAP